MPFGSWAFETVGRLRPLPLGTSKFVLAITVKDACQGETSFQWQKTNQDAPLRAVNRNREFGVVLATFHRVGPLAGLTLGLIATVGWIGLLGFVAIKLF
jgi:hypothetical protein